MGVMVKTMTEGQISESCYQSVKLFAHCANINLGQAEIIWEYDGYGEIIVENDCGHDESDHGSGEDIVSADDGYDVASYYLVAISGG